MIMVAAPIDTKGFSSPVFLDIDCIDPRPASEVRVAANSETIEQYAESIESLPPVLVIVDENGKHWLADGFHRFEGHRSKGLTSIRCRVKNGTYLDAYKLACHANDTHGLRTTNEDKRRRVEIAVKTFSDRSNRVIAEICGVSPNLVDKIKPSVQLPLDGSSKTIGKDGKARTASPRKPKPTPVVTPAPESESDPEPRDTGGDVADADPIDSDTVEPAASITPCDTAIVPESKSANFADLDDDADDDEPSCEPPGDFPAFPDDDEIDDIFAPVDSLINETMDGLPEYLKTDFAQKLYFLAARLARTRKIELTSVKLVIQEVPRDV